MSVERAPNAAFMMSTGDQTSEGNDPVQVEGYVSPPELKSYPMMATVGQPRQ